MNKIIISLVVLGILVGAGFAISKARKINQTNDKYQVMVNTWVGFGPFYLAQEKGFFSEEGINVELITNEDVAARKTALTAGRIDAIGDTVDTVVLERSEGVPAIAVLKLDESKGADGILATQNITSVKDLAGKQVLVQRNFVSEAFLQYVLKKNGVAEADVTFVDTEAGAAGAAFVAGKADVAVTYEPWLSKAKERSGGKILVSTADEPGILVDILTISEKTLANRSDDTQKVMRAWFKAIEYWQSHQEEANAIMAAHYNSSPTEFAELISGLEWSNHENNLAYFGTKEKPGKIYEVASTFADLFVETNRIKSKPDLSKTMTDDLLKSLYETR